MVSVSAEKIIRALGLIVSNAAVYGSAHAVTLQSLDACYQQLTEGWTSADVIINTDESGLMVNAETVVLKTMLIQHLAAHLEAREISNFTLKKETTRDQFATFIEVLMADSKDLQKLGGFAGALGAVGLSETVTARKVIYREIAEDEEVVAKAALEQLSQSRNTSGGSMQTVIAFLRGDDAVSEVDATRSVMDMGANTDELANLIMQAAEIRARTASVEKGETFGDLVVGFLRQTYDAMTHDPTFQTQKTKKTIQRTLALLERNLLTKLQAMGDDAVGAEAVLTDAVEGMTDELTLDALALEYAKKRNAIASSEKRILRYLKNKGTADAADTGIKQRLLENGLDEAGWFELLARSGGGLLPDDPGIGTLSHLLQTIETYVDGTGPMKAAPDNAMLNQPVNRARNIDVIENTVVLQIPEKLLKEKLGSVRQTVDQIVRRAEIQIEKLVEGIGREGEDASGKSPARPRLSRKQLFEILAEIGQELCQPLSVIHCTIDMLSKGTLGKMTELQSELLNTAADSGDKIKILVEKLLVITGLPSSYTVDQKLQSSLYS